jgi:hypothetical protein
MFFAVLRKLLAEQVKSPNLLVDAPKGRVEGEDRGQEECGQFIVIGLSPRWEKERKGKKGTGCRVRDLQVP